MEVSTVFAVCIYQAIKCIQYVNTVFGEFVKEESRNLVWISLQMISQDNSSGIKIMKLNIKSVHNNQLFVP